MGLCRCRSTGAMTLIAAWLLAAVTAAATGAAWGQAGGAPTDDPYTVSEIQVDVEAGDRAAARDQAFSQGQAEALQVLFERLGVADQVSAGTLTPAEQASLLLSMRVLEERTAPQRYIGRLAYTFRPESVRTFLRDRGIAYVEPAATAPVAPVVPDGAATPETSDEVSDEATDARTRPLLIVPVWRDGVIVRVWDSPNPWFDAWQNLQQDDSGPAFQTPYGDLDDVSALTPDQALSGNEAALDTLAGRYAASEVLVALAEAEGDVLTVTLIEPGPADPLQERFSIAGDPTDPGLLREAAAGVLRRLDGGGEAEDAEAAGPAARLQPIGPGTAGTRMPVRVILGQPRDWYVIRERLATNPTVSGASVRRLSTGVVEIELAFLGSEFELAQSLAEQGLVLTTGGFGSQLMLAQ